MSELDRAAVLALRSELAAIDPPRDCDRAAELAGLRAWPGDPARAGLSTREAAVARLAIRLGRAAGRAERLVVGRGGSKHFRALIREDTPFDWEAAPEHCRLAYLRGLFLARGSLSLAGGRTHLEFVVEEEAAPQLAVRLGRLGLPASWRIRRRRGIVTWKSAETVGTFLRRVGATSAVLEIEARAVSRSLRGELNRLLNAESVNLKRAVGAAGRQLAAIGRLDEAGLLEGQSPLLRSVGWARRDHPEATLGELSERLDIHRSAVQRALARLELLAAEAGPSSLSEASPSSFSEGGPGGRPPHRRVRAGRPMASCLRCVRS